MIKKYSDRRSAAIACLASLALLILGSCARKSAAPASGQSDLSRRDSAAGQAAAARGIGEAALSSDRARPASPREAKEGAAAAKPTLAASLRAFGLGARTAARMPYDFSLGLLQSGRPSGETEAAVLAVARSFVAGVAAGEVDSSIYLPEARDALSFLLAPAPLEAGAERSGARLGAIAIEGEAASLRLRLPGAKGASRIEALLSLRERAGAWYVESLALDPPSSAPLDFRPGALAAAP